VAVTLTPATSEPKSGSVTATAFITSAVASLGSHSCFCSSVPPATEGAGEDLGAGDQRAADAERTAGQLLGGHHHADVLADRRPRCSRRTPPDDRPKAPISARPVTISSGTSPLWRWIVLGDRLDLVLGEAPEGVLHHLEVVVEVAGAVGVGQGGEEIGRPVGGDEGLAHIQGGCGGGEVGGDGGCSDVGHRAMLRVGSLVFPDAISGTRDGSSPAVHMIQLDLTATSRVELCSA
jgi:hypothetical protein